MLIGASPKVGHFFNVIRHHDKCRLVYPAKWDIGQFQGAFVTDADWCIPSGGSFGISIQFQSLTASGYRYHLPTASWYRYHSLVPVPFTSVCPENVGFWHFHPFLFHKPSPIHPISKIHHGIHPKQLQRWFRINENPFLLS